MTKYLQTNFTVLFIRQFFAVSQWVEAGLNAGNSDAGKVIVRQLRSVFGSLVWSLPAISSTDCETLSGVPGSMLALGHKPEP
jgi:hypothetical protein